MKDFSPSNNAYSLEIVNEPIFPIKLIPIIEISPIIRALDVHTFVRERAFSILAAIQQNKPLPPVFIDQPINLTPPYKFRLYDGFHRYYLSKALGFSHIWAFINPSTEL